jgi:hypothetical protein
VRAVQRAKSVFPEENFLCTLIMGGNFSPKTLNLGSFQPSKLTHSRC